MLSLVKATGVDAKVEYVIKMPYKIVKTIDNPYGKLFMRFK